MKYLVFILLLISAVGYGQTKYYIRADTTQLEKVGSNNELNLLNSTRSKTGGYLKNVLNGRTGFFYAVDSAYISGSNLVLVRGGGSQNVTVAIPVGATPTWQQTLTAGRTGDSAFIDNGVAGESYSIRTRNIALGFPIVTFKPVSASKNIAFDIMPTGTPGDFAGNGIAWIDVCDANVSSDAGSVGSARVGITSTAAQFGSRAFNGATAKPVELVVNTDTRMTLSTSNTATFNIGKITQTQSVSGDYVGYTLLNTDNAVAESNPILFVGQDIGTARFGYLRWNNAATDVGYRDPSQFEIVANTGSTGGLTLGALNASGKITFVTSSDGITFPVRATIDNTGNVNIASLTASQLVQTDGSKNLVSTTALPNGTTATTQSPGTNNTTVATAAYVDAAVALVSSTWNGITSPTGDQALTFQAGESSTWTDQNTTEDLFTVNSSTGTTNSMFSLNRTSTALAAGNNIAEFISTGVNGTNGITAGGVVISVTNTNATSGTNAALTVTASGATTANNAIVAMGNVGISTTTPTLAKLQVQDGTIALVLGADNVATTLTNNTDKYGRFGFPHYTNSEEPVAGFLAASTSTTSTLSIGGNSGLLNAVTNIRFFTAANNTTVTGTEAMVINSNQTVSIGGSGSTYKLDVTGTVNATDFRGTVGATTPSTVAATTVSATGQISSTAAGAASTPAVVMTGNPYTAGTATTNHPLFYLNGGTAPTTWNTNGTYLGANAVSGFTGNFLDAHVNGGVSVFKVDYTGLMTLTSGIVVGNSSGYAIDATNRIRVANQQTTNINDYANNITAFNLGASTITVGAKMIPNASTYDLGSSSFGWQNIYLSGTAIKYNNVTTAAWGVPAIYGTGRSTAQTGAVASVATYTVGAADGSFEISANIYVTTSSAENFTMTCAYTDEGNTARTVTMPFITLAGATVAIINFANGAVPYEGIIFRIRCKAATAITIATAGTFTGAVYNCESNITQVK